MIVYRGTILPYMHTFFLLFGLVTLVDYQNKVKAASSFIGSLQTNKRRLKFVVAPGDRISA